MSMDPSELYRIAGDFSNASANIGYRGSAVVRKTAFDIQGDAKILSPVDTGFNENSITTDIHGTGVNTTAEVGPTSEYGGFLEEGTTKMEAQPYLGPAFKRRLPGYIAAVEQLGGEIL